MAQARMAIISTYCVVPLFCIPVFVCFTIHPFHRKEYPNETLYKVSSKTFINIFLPQAKSQMKNASSALLRAHTVTQLHGQLLDLESKLISVSLAKHKKVIQL